MKIAITGASGFIGSRVRAHFRNHVILDRNDTVKELGLKLQGVEVVINLAGAPIIRRWTRSYRGILRESRIITTAKVVEALNRTECVCHLVSASATGIYPQGMPCDENSSERAHDFLGELASEWEAVACRYRGPVTIFRLGVVLGPEGGALSKMLPPFRLGLGGPIGCGDMIMSWMDIEDLVRAYEFVAENRLTGVFNAVSPDPVTNTEFTSSLAAVLRRPAFLPVPVTVLRLLYGEAAEVLTGSWEVYPAGLQQAGFRFRYPTIRESLDHLLG